jgi:flagellar protein FlbT
MPLKIVLKPGERMIIDGAVIRNGDARAEFFVENRVPLLRQKDILTEESADTVCRRIYFTIQLMYIGKTDAVALHGEYWKLVQPLVASVPSTVGRVDRISTQILAGQYYQALKLAKELMIYEEEVMNRV